MSESRRRGRRHFTGRQKVAILKQHLVERRPISDLSDEHGIQPSQVYLWQKQLFELGESAFEQGKQPKLNRQLEDLRQQVLAKKLVIAQLAELVVDSLPPSGLAVKR